jgi:hypothetical protein
VAIDLAQALPIAAGIGSHPVSARRDDMLTHRLINRAIVLAALTGLLLGLDASAASPTDLADPATAVASRACLVPQTVVHRGTSARVQCRCTAGNLCSQGTARCRSVWDAVLDVVGLIPRPLASPPSRHHLLRWDRIAIVTDIDWIRETVRAFGFLMPGAVEIFPLDEVAAARAWILGADLA